MDFVKNYLQQKHDSQSLLPLSPNTPPATMNVGADSYVTSCVADIPSVSSSLSVSSFSPLASPVMWNVTVPSHPAEDGEEVVNGHVVESELHEHEQPPHPTPKVISPEDERPLVADSSLVADSYLSHCAEPISSLVNHTTEPFTMSVMG